MKKIISIILVLAMLLSFAACGDDKKNNDQPDNPQNTEELPFYSQGLTEDGRYNVKASDYVELPELDGVKFDESFWYVSDEVIQSQLDALVESYKSTEHITDRAVVSGDRVNIDYSGKIDGELFDGGTASGQTVTAGSREFIDDFLIQIIGHKPGETFDVEVTFPVPYPNDLDKSGKDAVFTVTINYIEDASSPEVNDAFIKEKFGAYYGVETVGDMKDYIRRSILDQSQSGLVDQYLVANSTVKEVPQLVIDHQKSCIKQNYIDTAASYGVDVDTLASYQGASNIDELIDSATDEIQEMAEDVMIYQAAAEKLGISVTDADVDEYFGNMTASGSASYAAAYGMPYLKLVVMTRLVVDYMAEHAVKQ